MSALDEAFAKIEANDKAFVETKARVQNDHRYRTLMAYSLKLDDDELTSAASVMASLASDRYHRSKRAGFLAIAREGQIKGKPGYAKAWLKKAAERRRVEVSCRALTFETATDAFCAGLYDAFAQRRANEPVPAMAAE